MTHNEVRTGTVKLPQRIEKWVREEYPQHPDKQEAIINELLEAASEGPTTGYHTLALSLIFPELNRH